MEHVLYDNDVAYILNDYYQEIEVGDNRLLYKKNIKIVSKIDFTCVTALREYCFAGNPCIETLEIKALIENVPSNAFRDCIALNNVILPATLKEIKRSAFEGCKALREIHIPDNINTIHPLAFVSCYDLVIYCKQGIIGQDTLDVWSSQNIQVREPFKFFSEEIFDELEKYL